MSIKSTNTVWVVHYFFLIVGTSSGVHLFDYFLRPILIIDDWNIDHRRWSKRCTTLGVPTLKK